jgi:hypothetical protein
MAKETYRVWLDDEEELDAYVIYANEMLKLLKRVLIK